MIKANTFYRAKPKVKGIATPNGYLYVYSATDNVTFGVTEEPKTELLTGNTFKLSLEEFLKIASDEVMREQ